MVGRFATFCTAAVVTLAISALGCDSNRGDGTAGQGMGDATSDAQRDRTAELNPPVAGGTNADRSAAAAPGAMGAGATGGEDATIVAEVRDKLRSSGEVEANAIDVRANAGVVTLTGRVSSEDVKESAEQLANDVEGVDRVENQIVVAQGPAAGAQNP
ncbi:MAG: BON domain-containing protein [Thermodesulfobacteriota bacterium]